MFDQFCWTRASCASASKSAFRTNSCTSRHSRLCWVRSSCEARMPWKVLRAVWRPGRKPSPAFPTLEYSGRRRCRRAVAKPQLEPPLVAQSVSANTICNRARSSSGTRAGGRYRGHRAGRSTNGIRPANTLTLALSRTRERGQDRPGARLPGRRQRLDTAGGQDPAKLQRRPPSRRKRQARWPGAPAGRRRSSPSPLFGRGRGEGVPTACRRCRSGRDVALRAA